MFLRRFRKNKPARRLQGTLTSFEMLEDRRLMAVDVGAPMPHATHSNLTPIVQTPVHHSHGHSENCNHGHHNPAVMALVSDAQATHIAVGSGNWSVASTWQNGVVPGQGARVVVPEGQTVIVDRVFQEELKTIRLNGTLKFATDANTQIKVDTLVSMPCGRLEIGTSTNPISGNVTAKLIIADDGAIDRNWDPTQVSRGLILMGHTDMFGAETTDKVVLAVQPTSGTRTLQLSSTPTNWKPGDQIVVTGTQGATSDELRTIASINGSSVSLDRALQRDHVAPKPGLNVYVANKTRNIEVRSENTSTLRRGHVMFAHAHNVNINHAGFYDLGRTDKSKELDDIHFEFDEETVGNNAGAPVTFTTSEGPANNIRGRYAIHFHRGGTDPTSTPATVNGSVVWGSPGWGFVNHSSHVNFTNNVAYGVFGSAYYTEAGDEIGTFDSNIAIRSVNPRSPINSDDGAIDPDLGHGQQEFGNSGDGFWLSGHLVSLKNNVSSGSSGHGIIIWSDGLVEADVNGRTAVSTNSIANGHLITGRTSIPTWWAPLAEVSNNEVSGSTIGFRTRYIHSQSYLGEGGSEFHKRPDQAYIDTLNPVIDGLKVWGNRDGIMMNYSERISLRNAEVVGIGAPWVLNGGTANVGAGLDLGTEISRGSGRIENVTIEGFDMGFVAPRNDQWTFENMTFRNTTDMLIQEPQLGPRTLTMSNFVFGGLEGTAVAGNSGSRRNIVMSAEFEGAGMQPYFFVLPDRITLDGKGIYYTQQAADHVPLDEHPEGSLEQIPATYINRTNQQLQSRFGLSFGGALLPNDAQSVGWLEGGQVGTAAPAATTFPRLLDMTNGGENPEPAPGGPTPELTGKRLEIRRGQTVTLMHTNLNTTDTNTGPANLTYTVSQVRNGFFAHRDRPETPVWQFTQAEVNGGVIRFVHDQSENAPDFRVTVTDGTTTTDAAIPTIIFDGEATSGDDPGNDDPGNDDPGNDDPGNDDPGNDDPGNDDPGNDDPQTHEIGFSGIARANHNWQTIELPRSFTDPVVVAGGASRVGGHQGVVRIRNVTSDSFQIRFQEWDYLDGRHAFENISYFVIEAGQHELTDGTIIMAGVVEARHEAVVEVEFPGDFTAEPVVLGQVMTNNGPASVTDRIHDVSESGFEVRMQEEEDADHRHNRETIGWIAIQKGNAISGETSMHAMVDSNVNHIRKTINFGDIGGASNPVIFSDMQTRKGGDPATVRHWRSDTNSVNLMIEEEQSSDDEIAHIGEAVGILAMEPGMLIAKTESGGDSESLTSNASSQPRRLKVQLPIDPAFERLEIPSRELESKDNFLMSSFVMPQLSGFAGSTEIQQTDTSTIGVDSKHHRSNRPVIEISNLDSLDSVFEEFDA